MDVVIRVAADLVNLLTPGEDRGRRYVPPAGDERTAAVGTVLRRAGAVDDAARQVNALLVRTGARPELERHDGEPWHLHFHAADNSLPNGWAAGCATGLAVVLGGELHDRLGVCTAPRCDRVYVDTSRNGTRRFCSTSCQNRVKTAAFRARLP
jgi:predicted RNA-binding Zn ribbon-like protein